MSIMIIEIGQWPATVVGHHLKTIGYDGKIAALETPNILLDGFTSGIVLTGDSVMTAAELVRRKIDIRFVGAIVGITPDSFNVVVHDDILALAKQYLDEQPTPSVRRPLLPYGSSIRQLPVTTSH